MERQLQRIGGDLGHHRIGAGPEILGARLHQYDAIAAEDQSCLGFRTVHRVGRARHPPADQQIAIAHRSRLGRTAGPAERLGAGEIALAQRLARERPVLVRVGLGVIREAQFDRVDLDRGGQLVQGRFERKAAARLARCPHIGRQRHVQRDEPMARRHARAGVEHLASQRHRLGKLTDRRI